MDTLNTNTIDHGATIYVVAQFLLIKFFKSSEKWRLYVEHINAFQVALMTSTMNVVFKSNLAGIHDITRDDALILNTDMHAVGFRSSNNTAATRMYRNAP